MAVEFTWYGHGTWGFRSGEHRVIIDPFLNDSPTSPVKAAKVDATHVLVSHGHFDHVADVAEIANRTGATVVAVYEVADWLARKQGVKNTIGMNVGGGVNLPFGRVKMTLAFHSSGLPDHSYGGVPVGFLISLPIGNVYFACDTALFQDMQLIGEEQLQLAVLPIGDLFTMGPDDSIRATKLLRPQRVAPSHYNTFPPIEQDAEKWAQRIRQETSAEPLLLTPGGSFIL
jgi:L-ascorbate metabolism protein UlaG (beta-lactamase superfamily)